MICLPSTPIVQVIKSWETGLVRVKDDLLAMSRDLTRRMEKVAETGSNFLSAGNIFYHSIFNVIPFL